jgi:endoglucanase
MGRGVNMLGYDGIWQGAKDAPFKEKYFGMIKDAGFGHVRINLHGFSYMDAQNVLSDQMMLSLDWVIEQSLSHGLVPVLDEHDFHVCQIDAASCESKLVAFWTQISDRYAGRYPQLIFELLNEPGGNMTADWWNEFYPKLLEIVRAASPERTVIIAALNTEDPYEVHRLLLPEEDRSIIVTVHYYKPMRFTHQGAPWASQYARIGPTKWGSDADKAQVAEDLRIVNTWAKAMRRPIYLGEFGVYDAAPMDARARYFAFLTQTAESLGWAWAYWQLTHDFNLLDTATDKWKPQILEALMGARETDAGSPAKPGGD